MDREDAYRRPMRSLAVALACSALLGCLGHQSAPARAQEAATELNVNSRFGRMELAAERVAPVARDAFMQRRKAWGGDVRVADYEVAAFHMKSEADAEMLVRVAWYRMDQGDLRTTTLKQKWHDFKGDWRLVDETRAEGALGLLGEPPPPSTPGPARRTQFPTVRLGSSDAPAAIPDALDDTPAAASSTQNGD